MPGSENYARRNAFAGRNHSLNDVIFPIIVVLKNFLPIEIARTAIGIDAETVKPALSASTLWQRRTTDQRRTPARSREGKFGDPALSWECKVRAR